MTGKDKPKFLETDGTSPSLISEYDPGVEIEDTSTNETITEPFDPAQIRVESKIYTLDLMLTRIREGEINLAPDFQRASIWTITAQSKLVESVLLRIPLPAFYMDATNENNWLVVDGLQRLTALKKFVITQELRLEGLEFLDDFTNKTFDELPRSYQRRILETQITVFLIEENTPPEVKFNIFKRINTGGLPLSAQEIRHALNQGIATEMLASLASSKPFKQATNNSIRPDRMADREMVLRYLAFTIRSYTSYRTKDFDAFLNDAMAIINTITDSERENLTQSFFRSMNAAYEIFGEDAFRKRTDTEHSKRPINKALFEAWAVNLGKQDEEALRILINKSDKVKRKFIEVMNSGAFNNSVTQATGDIKQVQTRFGVIEELLDEVLYD
jgi:uncharacterized protein with ParB-like and HNH nuclease domain